MLERVRLQRSTGRMMGHPWPQQPHFLHSRVCAEFGKTTPTVRNIMTLKSCAPISGAGGQLAAAAAAAALPPPRVLQAAWRCLLPPAARAFQLV